MMLRVLLRPGMFLFHFGFSTLGKRCLCCRRLSHPYFAHYPTYSSLVLLHRLYRLYCSLIVILSRTGLKHGTSTHTLAYKLVVMSVRVTELVKNPDVYLIEGLSIRRPVLAVSCHVWSASPFTSGVQWMRNALGSETMSSESWCGNTASAATVPGPAKAIAEAVALTSSLKEVGWHFDMYQISTGKLAGLSVAWHSNYFS